MRTKGEILDDILATGAAWITDRELEDIGSELKSFRASWFRLRAAATYVVDEIDKNAEPDLPDLRDRLNRAIWG